MFAKMKNIDTAFRHVKLFTMLIVTGCFLLCGFVLYKSYELSAILRDKVYILAGDKAIEAYAADRKDNLGVEAKSHIAIFHTKFFTLDPDEKVINENIMKALYLADGSAKRQYDDLKENGYYSGVISGNISQHIMIDSISINIQTTPYLFRCHGILEIIRPRSISTRNLLTQGFLRNVSRSDHNPHGFLIERWEILDNSDIKTEAR